MKTEHIIIGAFIIVFFGLTAMLIVANGVHQAYQQGVQDAQVLINQQILNQLQSQGYVQFSFVIENQTRTINLVPYQE